ncbi:MAG: tRNA (guanosine(37)-N1)-methyltransferase TrmD [Clostridia bacterium]|nr:tRNA (guanosine(37)-N1)-methyltransferase TrmD [Clostridia bacterium]
MTFKLLTIFPDMVRAVLSESILGRALERGAIKAEVIDIRPFSLQKHKNTDDAPYGGGAGMVMTPQPTADAIVHAMGEHFSGKRIYLSPKGHRFDQKKAEELAKEDELILLAGHYEGLDQRVIDLFIDEEISVGDYVLTGGELGALIIVDAVSRLLPGVLGCDESSVDESFSSGLLEYPQYTRPREFMGLSVPGVLLNGNQKEIDRWRADEAIKLTYARRPELLSHAPEDREGRALLRQLRAEHKFNAQVISSDIARSRRIRARLEERSRGEICFGEGTLIDLDGASADAQGRRFLPYLPNENGQASGWSLYAFDGTFRALCGDMGIRQAVFSGIGENDFACLAAMLLPFTRADAKAVHYIKGARAMLRKGDVPKVTIEYFDGLTKTIELNDESQGLIDALWDFVRGLKLPVDDEQINAARLILASRAQSPII